MAAPVAPGPTTDVSSSPGDATPSGYRPQLDGIRALAVIAVIAFHLGYPWMPGGFIGVDVFFVLSGYLITGLLLNEVGGRGSISFTRFYSRRARRLLPASLLVLVVVIFGANALLDPVGQHQVGIDVTWSALYAANWRFLQGSVDYFQPGDVPSPVQHFWSLAVEEQFYLLWPLLFGGLWRWSTRRRGPDATGGLMAVVAAIAIGSAGWSLVTAGTNFGYFATTVRAYQLLAGALLALAADRWGHRVPTGRRSRRSGTVLSVAALGVLGFAATTITGEDSYPGGWGLVVTAATLALIVGIDRMPRGPVTAVLGARAPARIGQLSYSLYLWHWPIIVFAPLVADRHDAPVLAERWMIVAVTVVVSVASFRLVERPIRFDLWPRAPRPAVIGTGLACSLVVALIGIPFLQPRDPSTTRYLAAVKDLAEPGPCPYFREQWGPPSESEPCVYREGDGPTIAFVGDSHAQQWQPAVLALAERYDMTVVRLTRRGCPPNDLTVQSYDDQGIVRTDVPCTQWRRRVLPAAIERYDPDLIFVEGRSHEWAFRVGDRTVEVDDPDHVDLWADSWDPTLDVLTAGSGQVVVAETLPNMPFRVPACLLEHGADSGECDMPLADDPSRVAYNEAMRRAVDRPDVTLVDLTPIVCPDDVCPAMIDGVVVHRDDDHLTASFAEASAGAFERTLRGAGVPLP